VVRLLLAPSPFGMVGPQRIWDEPPPAPVISDARSVYLAALPDTPPPLPELRERRPRAWAKSIAGVAAAVILFTIVAAWPRAARIGPVPLAVVPLAPAAVAPAPSDAAPRVSAGPVAAVYVVRPGDTLWSVASRALGDPFRWQEVWRANAGRKMADGSRFVDPDLIRPGWRLSLRARGGG
jgi:nucleoid-associated protein YgaU